MTTFNINQENQTVGTQNNVGSSVWHDGEEIPEEGRNLLADIGYGIQGGLICTYDKIYSSFDNESYCHDAQDVKRWMYIPD